MAQRQRKLQGKASEDKYYLNGLAENADEAEWQAVLNGAAHFSAGTVDDEMSEAADQDSFPNARADDRLQGKEMVMEAIQGSLAEAIAVRKALLGEAYPFKIEHNSLVYQPSDIPIYELMLGICQAPTLTTKPYVDLPRIFETLSVLAGRGYLGLESGGYRMGWPRPTDMSRFKNAVEDLKQKSGNFASEWQWAPAEHLPGDPSPKFVKEDGLDVVVWRRWQDGRTGQMYLLGQCACGRDWLEKDKDLDLEVLRDWFHPPRVKPVRSFFTPRYAVDTILTELSYKAGVVFDRVRMVTALRAHHVSDELDQLAEQIRCCVEIAKQPLLSIAKAQVNN